MTNGAESTDRPGHEVVVGFGKDSTRSWSAERRRVSVGSAERRSVSVGSSDDARSGGAEFLRNKVQEAEGLSGRDVAKGKLGKEVKEEDVREDIREDLGGGIFQMDDFMEGGYVGSPKKASVYAGLSAMSSSFHEGWDGLEGGKEGELSKYLEGLKEGGRGKLGWWVELARHVRKVMRAEELYKKAVSGIEEVKEKDMKLARVLLMNRLWDMDMVSLKKRELSKLDERVMWAKEYVEGYEGGRVLWLEKSEVMRGLERR